MVEWTKSFISLGLLIKSFLQGSLNPLVIGEGLVIFTNLSSCFTDRTDSCLICRLFKLSKSLLQTNPLKWGKRLIFFSSKLLFLAPFPFLDHWLILPAEGQCDNGSAKINHYLHPRKLTKNPYKGAIEKRERRKSPKDYFSFGHSFVFAGSNYQQALLHPQPTECHYSTNPNNALLRGNPSKLPYTCIV